MAALEGDIDLKYFDNEYDLAMMVIQGMKNRSEIGDDCARTFYI